jgi:hypothetical protein
MPLTLAEKLHCNYLLSTSGTPICDVLEQEDHPEKISYLIEQGASINGYIHQFPGKKSSALIHELVPLESARLYARDYSMLTLLKAGAKVDIILKESQCSLLHENLIFNKKNPFSIMLLWLHYGADPARSNKKGINCFDYLISSPEALALLKNAQLILQEIQIKDDVAKQAVAKGDLRIAMTCYQDIAGLYQIRGKQEAYPVFKKHYFAKAVEYTQFAIQACSESEVQIKLINKQLFDLCKNLANDSYFSSTIEQALELCKTLEQKHISSGDFLTQLYDAMAGLCTMMNASDVAKKYASKAASLLIPSLKNTESVQCLFSPRASKGEKETIPLLVNEGGIGKGGDSTTLRFRTPFSERCSSP